MNFLEWIQNEAITLHTIHGMTFNTGKAYYRNEDNIMRSKFLTNQLPQNMPDLFGRYDDSKVAGKLVTKADIIFKPSSELIEFKGNVITEGQSVDWTVVTEWMKKQGDDTNNPARMTAAQDNLPPLVLRHVMYMRHHLSKIVVCTTENAKIGEGGHYLTCTNLTPVYDSECPVDFREINPHAQDAMRKFMAKQVVDSEKYPIIEPSKHTIDGVTKTIYEWSLDSRCVVDRDQLHNRVHGSRIDGWTFEECVTTPVGKTPNRITRKRNQKKKTTQPRQTKVDWIAEIFPEIFGDHFLTTATKDAIMEKVTDKRYEKLV